MNLPTGYPHLSELDWWVLQVGEEVMVDDHSGHGRARRAKVCQTSRHNITCDAHGRDYSKTLLLFIITQKVRTSE